MDRVLLKAWGMDHLALPRTGLDLLLAMVQALVVAQLATAHHPVDHLAMVHHQALATAHHPATAHHLATVPLHLAMEWDRHRVLMGRHQAMVPRLMGRSEEAMMRLAEGHQTVAGGLTIEVVFVQVVGAGEVGLLRRCCF